MQPQQTTLQPHQTHTLSAKQSTTNKICYKEIKGDQNNKSYIRIMRKINQKTKAKHIPTKRVESSCGLLTS